jgi:hypothetical protein
LGEEVSVGVVEVLRTSYWNLKVWGRGYLVGVRQWSGPAHDRLESLAKIIHRGPLAATEYLE